MHDTVRELEQKPEAPGLGPLPGRRVPHMRGTERKCKCRSEAVRRLRRADTPLPELYSWELRILARLRPDILAHSKLHSPERPATLRRSGILARPKFHSPERFATLHRTGNRDDLRSGDADGPSRRNSAGGKCAPNGYGGEERDAAAADAQALAAPAWPEFSLPPRV